MALRIQFLGHSGFYLQCGSTSIIVDPFFQETSSYDVKEIKDLRCDLLLLTHGHQDHIKDASLFLTQTGCQMIANYEILFYPKNIEPLVI